MEQKSATKSKLVFDVINASEDFYSMPVDSRFRSRVNIPFRILPGRENSEDLEGKFLKEAAGEGLLALKGHRSVGGLRASLYNAVSVEQTRRLADFMVKFMERNKQ